MELKSHFNLTQGNLVKLIIAIFAAIVLFSPAFAATSAKHQEVMIPIKNLFDGMREGNGDKVLAAFADKAFIHRAHATLRTDTTAMGFANAVNNKGDAVWDEKIWDIEVKVDDRLASVWTEFAFVLNGNLSHCGVNSFQLYKFEDGWKIIHLVDTFRQEGCFIPEHAE